MEPLITLRDAESRIFQSCRPLGEESIPLAHSIGRVLAAPVVADRPLPPFARAMMDGVAFNSAKTRFPSQLQIAGLHAAGDSPPRALEPGEAWEIMTGAAVPADCDTVVPYEDLSDSFRLTAPFTPGQSIHPMGLDAGAGEVLVARGTRVGPTEVAIAASVGNATLSVYRRPVISLITTGDEAIPVESKPEPWQIRRSNGPMLEAILVRLGMAPAHHLHVNDDFSAVSETIRQALAQSDVLIICGGISKGRKDHIRASLESLLGSPAFHGVEQRPGKPLAFWPGPPQVFALPGNPVSVLATFTRYVLPALMKLAGAPMIPLTVSVAGVTPLPRFSWLLPVAVGEDGHLVVRAPKNSGDYVSVAGSVGIIEVPPAPEYTSGQNFAFYPLS